MADLLCGDCKRFHKAKSWRLVSKSPAFVFERLYIVEAKGTCSLIMRYRGESPDGTLAAYEEIDPGARAYWRRRAMTEEARPEAQLMSQWAERMAGPIEGQIQYQTKLCEAHKWYRGQRVVVST